MTARTKKATKKTAKRTTKKVAASAKKVSKKKPVARKRKVAIAKESPVDAIQSHLRNACEIAKENNIQFLSSVALPEGGFGGSYNVSNDVAALMFRGVIQDLTLRSHNINVQ